MKTTKLFLAAIMLATLVFPGCKDDDDGGNGACTGGSNFGFLTVGNRWESSFSSLFSADTFLVAEVVDEPETGVFKVTVTLEPSGSASSYYLQDCGDFLLKCTNLPIKPEDQYMKANRSVGDNWTYTDRATLVASNYQVVEKNVTFSTPAGTFTGDKITYHQGGTFNTDTIFFNNDFFFLKYDGFSEYELVSKNF